MNTIFPSVSTSDQHSRYNLLAVLGLAILVVLFWFSSPAYAHDGQDSHTAAQANTTDVTSADDSSEDEYVPEQYEYSVVKGQNMTLLVRRSILLLDQARPGVNLDKARIIYTETNVTQALGARDLIHPGENLTVSAELIEKFVASSQDLSADSLAAWQAYADNADFDLADIQASNVEVSDDGQLQAVDDNEDSEPVVQTEPDSEAAEATDNETPTWLWLFLGAGTLALLWYALWRQPEDKK